MTQYIYNDLTTKYGAVEVPEGAINLVKSLRYYKQQKILTGPV